MSHDQETYRRASTAALIGLATQVVLSILVSLTGLYAGASGVNAIAWYFIGGLPIWAILWLIYNQHRLERVEALETEQLAAEDARTAALFEEAGQQLQIAQKRLDRLYKYGTGLVSLVVSIYLLSVGTFMLFGAVAAYRSTRGVEAGSFFSDIADMVRAGGGFTGSSAGAVAIVAFMIAFPAFLVARYVAGMTKVEEWRHLRGGASYLMGNAVATVLLIAVAVCEALNLAEVFPVLAVVVPAMMILLGAEMLLSLIFGFYQPRRPGVRPRPAFDSRLLGWLTHHESLGKIIGEAINYQFGFEVSESWFYRLLAKAVTPLTLVGLFVLFGLTSAVLVQPHQRAVITRWGALTDHSVVGPGLHWKLPWPLGKAYKYDASRVHEINVGSSAENFNRNVAVLWTTQHTGESEQYMVTAPSQTAGADENTASKAVAGELAGGLGIVKYRIADGGLLDYTQSSDEPVKLLTAISERRFNQYYATHNIDELLTSARIEAGDILRKQIQADADAMNLGVEIVYAGLDAVHPPREGDVAKKFHEQIDARQEKQTRIQEAQRKAVAELAQIAGSQDKALTIDAAIQEVVLLQQSLEAMRLAANYDSAKADQLADQVLTKQRDIELLLDEAGGNAAKLIYDARAYRWEFALNERARAMRTTSLLNAYRQAPKYFMAREYLNTLAEGLKDRRKFIIVGEQELPPIIRLNAQTTASNLDVLGIE
ncbi:MAG: SPFH domain-containing protein [Phycisphaerales bacterium]